MDAAPGVEVPGGSFVTVESGPHPGLDQALHALRYPKVRVSGKSTQVPRPRSIYCDRQKPFPGAVRAESPTSSECHNTGLCVGVQAHVLPDIVWLPSDAPCYAPNEPVALKPRLVVSAETVQQARETKWVASSRPMHSRGVERVWRWGSIPGGGQGSWESGRAAGRASLPVFLPHPDQLDEPAATCAHSKLLICRLAHAEAASTAGPRFLRSLVTGSRA